MRFFQTRTAAILMVITVVHLQNSAIQSSCVDAAGLKVLNMMRTNPQIVNNGTCRALYAAGGACVSVSETLAELRKKYDWLRLKSIEAKNYNHQRPNASLYFRVRNGQMTKMEAQTQLNLSKSPTNSIISKVTNIMASIASSFQNMFGGPEWLKRVFDSSLSQINPCFQTLQNLTDSTYCVFTSANNFGRFANPQGEKDQRLPSYFVSANLRTTGQMLRQCSALIDTYCTLTYGISVVVATRPFNQTFNWGDNSGISERTCSAIAGFMNSTSVTEIAALDALLVDLFHTAWIRFVPSQQAIENLGAFLTNKEFDKEPREFNPIVSSPAGFGLGISTLVNQGNEADLVEISKTTGAPILRYSVSRFAISAVITVFSLMTA